MFLEVYQYIQKEGKRLYQEEQGTVSVMMAILFPVLLWMMVYFENEMQVRYVYMETQSILDIATNAGAMTGEAVATQNAVFCTIPYNSSNPDYSGYHVTTYTLRENLHNLPDDMQTEIVRMIYENKMKGLDDPDLRASGYVKLSVDLTYTPQTSVLFQKYRIKVSSTSRCQALKRNTGGTDTSVDWNGPVLTPQAGAIQGPSGKETYYNLDMSGVVDIMRGMGNNDEYWVRSDGVKMLGDYIMVAADLNIHPRGSLVDTSLGKAIVCDTGSFIYSNPYQLDIAVTW